MTKPSYTLSETEHKFLGNTYYYPGAVTWDAVTATIVNAVNPDGNAIFMAALFGAGWMDPNQQDGAFQADDVQFKTPNKQAAQNTLGMVNIVELDGKGAYIGRWDLENPWLTNVKFGDLDYSSEELLNIELSFRYDWATYTASNKGGGLRGGPINGLEAAPTPPATGQA